MCTDGCQSGFVAILMKHLQNEELLSFNCIIHQESLSVKFGKDLKSVMKKVVNIVNYIRSWVPTTECFMRF